MSSKTEVTDLTKTLDAIEARRSVRKFDESRTVEESVMRRVVECAMCSPTAVNSREWHFVVVRDAATRAQLAGAVPYCRFAAEPTAVCVVVCAELAKEKAPGHWPQDCGAAVQTMLIAAAALGVGSTWTSLHPFEDVCVSFTFLHFSFLPFHNSEPSLHREPRTSGVCSASLRAWSPSHSWSLAIRPRTSLWSGVRRALTLPFCTTKSGEVAFAPTSQHTP